jgi:hypothetical protein
MQVNELQKKDKQASALYASKETTSANPQIPGSQVAVKATIKSTVVGPRPGSSQQPRPNELQ